MVAMSRVPLDQDVVLQGLDFYEALAPSLLVAMLPHAGCHGLKCRCLTSSPGQTASASGCCSTLL